LPSLLLLHLLLFLLLLLLLLLLLAAAAENMPVPFTCPKHPPHLALQLADAVFQRRLLPQQVLLLRLKVGRVVAAAANLLPQLLHAPAGLLLAGDLRRARRRGNSGGAGGAVTQPPPRVAGPGQLVRPFDFQGRSPAPTSFSISFISSRHFWTSFSTLPTTSCRACSARHWRSAASTWPRSSSTAVWQV
jgi:hypothetical protein